MIKKKVFVYKSENSLSSVGLDYINTVNLIKKSTEFEVVNNPFQCAIIYFPWWNEAVKFKYLLKFSNKKIIAVLTNEIKNNLETFDKLKNIIDLWVCANKTQVDFIKSKLLNYYYHPFYVDENIYKKLSYKKEDILKIFNIECKITQNKKIILSAQRDSLGADLKKPKWQKGPDKLLEIIKGLPSDSFHLLLAGSRRHWLIKNLEEMNIEYTYIGQKYDKDDIHINTISQEKMNLLYNLADLYIVSSKSEGGPKAIIEAMLCKTLIISSDVGLAKDFLNKDLIYSTSKEAIEIINSLMYDEGKRNIIINRNFKKVSELNNIISAQKRIFEILNYFKL